jgi:hypothetical protein
MARKKKRRFKLVDMLNFFGIYSTLIPKIPPKIEYLGMSIGIKELGILSMGIG